ncbi:MAG: T9SS type A sorting domain-containing protein, partial [Flavobacterium sp.]
KYWFTDDPFVEIPGATGPEFTYDWNTYDQALLKVVVTLGGNSFESNTIQIDSYAWAGLTIGFENSPNVSVDPNNGNVNLCQGTSFTLEVFMPYTNVKWFKDDVLIAGATSMQYVVTEPGSYYVIASPDFCPNSTSSTQGLPIVVQIDTTCGLGVDESHATFLSCYPNPVRDIVSINSLSPTDEISIYDISGRKVYDAKPENNTASIDLSALSSGTYILKVDSGSAHRISKIVKR